MDHSAQKLPPPIVAVTPPKPPRRWRWIALSGLGLGLVVAAILFQFNPVQHAFYPQCTLHRVTGLNCPGCGGLRAMHHLLHGELATAFRFNPFVLLALPVLVWLGARRLLGRPPLSNRAIQFVAWVGIGGLVVFGVLRNLPLAMFQLPPQ